MGPSRVPYSHRDAGTRQGRHTVKIALREAGHCVRPSSRLDTPVYTRSRETEAEMNNGSKKLAILCGGGPAPGINSVISAVTIEARNSGLDVIGIRDGFEHLIEGDTSEIRTLEHRGRVAHPLPGRVDPADLARQPDQEPRSYGQRRQGAAEPGRRLPRDDRGRRHRVRRIDRGAGGRRLSARRSRAEDDRQRPADAAGHADVRLRDARASSAPTSS